MGLPFDMGIEDCTETVADCIGLWESSVLPLVPATVLLLGQAAGSFLGALIATGTWSGNLSIAISSTE